MDYGCRQLQTIAVQCHVGKLVFDYNRSGFSWQWQVGQLFKPQSGCRRRHLALEDEKERKQKDVFQCGSPYF